MSPSFPFLLLGLHVFVCVCFRKSCFDFPSSACLVLLCRSLPPSFGGGEAGEPEMSLVLLSPPTPPRVSPAANISMECPATTLESRGGARLLHGSLLRRYLPAPLPSSVAGVALHRVASLGGGGSRRSLVVWASGAVASSVAGDCDPSSGRSSRLSGATWRPLLYYPSTLELPRDLHEGCDSAAGPEAELSDTAYAGGDSLGFAEA